MADDDEARFYALAGIDPGRAEEEEEDRGECEDVGGGGECVRSCPPVEERRRRSDGAASFVCERHGVVHAHGAGGTCRSAVYDRDTGSSICPLTGLVVVTSHLYDGGGFVRDCVQHVPAPCGPGGPSSRRSRSRSRERKRTKAEKEEEEEDSGTRLSGSEAAAEESVTGLGGGGGEGAETAVAVRAGWVTEKTTSKVRMVSFGLVKALFESDESRRRADKHAVRVGSSAIASAVDMLNAEYEAHPAGDGLFDMASAVAKLVHASTECGRRTSSSNVRRMEYYSEVAAMAWSAFPPGPASLTTIAVFVIGVLYHMRKPDGLDLSSVLAQFKVYPVLPYDPFTLNLPRENELEDMVVHLVPSSQRETRLAASMVQKGRRMVREAIGEAFHAAAADKTPFLLALGRLSAFASWPSYDTSVARHHLLHE